jgi:hypothetical protein
VARGRRRERGHGVPALVASGADVDAALEIGVEDELASARLPGFTLALSSLLGA